MFARKRENPLEEAGMQIHGNEIRNVSVGAAASEAMINKEQARYTKDVQLCSPCRELLKVFESNSYIGQNSCFVACRGLMEYRTPRK